MDGGRKEPIRGGQVSVEGAYLSSPSPRLGSRAPALPASLLRRRRGHRIGVEVDAARRRSAGAERWVVRPTSGAGDTMRFWVTVQWPPRDRSDPSDAPAVWLAEECKSVGTKLARGDLVVVYQTKTGPSVVVEEASGAKTTVARAVGRQGVIYYGRALQSFEAHPESQPETYLDGSRTWWKWFAPLHVLSRSGFVSMETLARTLGYKPAFRFRGFGPMHSGLQNVPRETFDAIVAQFHAARPILLPDDLPFRSHGGGGTGLESEAHRRLKERVAANPSLMLGEEGLRTVKIEYPFPSGDRADVVLADVHERIIGVEIETEVGKSDVVGPLQAIKYRFMLEWMCRRERGDSRAILVAHRIDPFIRSLCGEYEVECKEVPRDA